MRRALFLLFTFFSVFGFAEVEVPYLSGRVVDNANILSWQSEDELSAILERIEDSSGAQIAILTIESTEEETIEEFSIRVFDEWQLGRAEYDDGLLIVVASIDRNVRIEVGYGLEGTVTDYHAKMIIENFALLETEKKNLDDHKFKIKCDNFIYVIYFSILTINNTNNS